MASVFVVKEKLTAPMEWYAKVMECTSVWEFDDEMEMYHLGNVYMKEYENHISFEDFSEENFFGWETSSWIALAEEKELIYGYYSEDSGDAEFIHIKNGKCVREYRVYDFEVDTDEGDVPEFEGWIDVSEYVDEKLI